MDYLTVCRSAVRQVLSRYIDLDTQGAPPDGARTDCTFDEDRDQYLVVRAGWSGQRRVKGIVLHLRIAGGQVWVEENGTDVDIAGELVGLGVRPADVVLGFIHPSLRESLALAVT